MSTLAERIQEIISAGFPQVDLARAAGVTKGTANQWLNGGIKSMKLEYAEGIQSLTGFSATWIVTGKGKKKIEPPYHGDERRAESRAHEASPSSPYAHFNAGPELQTGSGRYVPIVGSGQGGPDGYISIDDFPPGQGDGEIYTFSQDRNAYAIRVRGDSMRPRIKSGEFIVAEPGVEAQPGDDVVVKLKNEKAMVKELLWMVDGEVCLGSINSAIPPITLLQEEILSIHRVAAIVPRGSALLRNRTE